MPKYQISFDTVNGEVRHWVDIDDDERLDRVLDEILWELKERGRYLKGKGEPQVKSNNDRILDFALPLKDQGVYPSDLLRVSTRPING